MSRSQQSKNGHPADNGVEVKNPLLLPSSEAEEAKDYWGNRGFDYYKAHRPWTDFMVERILALQPASVFELGCNAGKNLVALRGKAPDLFVAGADINRGAVEYGRSENALALTCGDETLLDVIPDRTYDCVFTVSVLDHLPAPGPALANLARISRKGLLLLEPFTGEEGKVMRNVDRRSGEWIDTTPFSYLWNYPQLIETLLPDWDLAVEAFPLGSNLGRFYHLFQLTPRA